MEKEMVRTIEHNRSQTTALEAQISALEYERARISEVCMYTSEVRPGAIR